MKALTILAATLLLGLSAFAQDNRSFKEESINLVEQGVRANQLSYSLVGHPREGASQSEAGQIRMNHTSGEIALDLISMMRRSLSGPVAIDTNQVSFSCDEANSHCDLSIVGTLSADDKKEGYMDRAVLNFSIEIENGHPVRVKDNRLTLHLYAAGVQ